MGRAHSRVATQQASLITAVWSARAFCFSAVGLAQSEGGISFTKTKRRDVGDTRMTALSRTNTFLPNIGSVAIGVKFYNATATVVVLTVVTDHLLIAKPG